MEYSESTLSERKPMKTVYFLLLVSAMTGAAQAQTGELQRCRAIGDNTQRLACYDALAAKPAAPAPAMAAPAAAPAPAVAATSRQAQEQAFGLQKKSQEITSIESSIPGMFDGWRPNQNIKLANGQVWRIVDDSEGMVYGKDLKVIIERGALGANYMEIQGINKAPKVRRIQ